MLKQNSDICNTIFAIQYTTFSTTEYFQCIDIAHKGEEEYIKKYAQFLVSLVGITHASIFDFNLSL